MSPWHQQVISPIWLRTICLCLLILLRFFLNKVVTMFILACSCLKGDSPVSIASDGRYSTLKALGKMRTEDGAHLLWKQKLDNVFSVRQISFVMWLYLWWNYCALASLLSWHYIRLLLISLPKADWIVLLYVIPSPHLRSLMKSNLIFLLSDFIDKKAVAWHWTFFYRWCHGCNIRRFTAYDNTGFNLQTKLNLSVQKFKNLGIFLKGERIEGKERAASRGGKRQCRWREEFILKVYIVWEKWFQSTIVSRLRMFKVYIYLDNQRTLNKPSLTSVAACTVK